MGKMLASSFYQLLKNLEGQGKRKEQYPMSHKACRFICKNLVTVSCDTLVSQGRWTKTGIHGILTVTQPFFQTLDLSSTSLCWILVLRTKVVKDPFFHWKSNWKRHNREGKCQQSQRDGYILLPHKEWPLHAVKWASYIDEKEQTQTITVIMSKHRTCYTIRLGIHQVLSVG